MTVHPLVSAKVQRALSLPTKKEAETAIGRVIQAIEEILLEHLDDNGFALKLGSLGKFTVRHLPAYKRKNVFTGDVREVPAKRKVKFVTYGPLRELEKVRQQPSARRTSPSTKRKS